MATFCLVFVSAALLVLLSPQGAESRCKRQTDSNIYHFSDRALSGFSSVGTRRLQYHYVNGYKEVMAAKDAVTPLVVPCKDKVSAVVADIKARCLPCVIGHCSSRALDCQIQSTPVNAPTCDALKSAADNKAIGRLCSHYMRGCPRTSFNDSLDCAKLQCRTKIESCNPCNQGSLNSAVCDVFQAGLDTKTFFDTTLPSFFEEDVASAFTDVGSFFQEDVQGFITSDVPNFFKEDFTGFFTDDFDSFLDDTAGDFFVDVTADAGTFFDGAFASAGEFFDGAFDDAVNFFGEGFDELDAFGDSLDVFFTDAFDGIDDAFGDIGDVFGDIGDIGDVVGDIGDGIGDLLGKKRRRRSVGVADCTLIAAKDSRQRECVSSYRGTCGALCQYATDTGLDLPAVCPVMSSANATFVAKREANRWVLRIPRTPTNEIKMTFSAFSLDKSTVDAAQLYAAQGTATVWGTTYTFATRSGHTSATFKPQLPNIIRDAIAAYRGAVGL